MEMSPAKGRKARKAKKRRKFSPEFRARAVKLAERHPDKPLKALAKELGVAYGTLCQWVAKAREPGATPNHPESLEGEVKRLRKQVEVLQEEREILKKAITFFAKESE